MKKDAFYFPHFCNARHDRKIKRVTKELGVEGYGIYFMLLEVLREQTDFKFPMEDIDLLSDEFGTSEQKVRTVICNYQLFEVDEDEKFFSTKLVYYLAPYLEKSERARLAANKRWSASKVLMLPDANAYANAIEMQCVGNASKVEESECKVEEIKLDEIKKTKIIKPIEDFVDTRTKFEICIDEFRVFRKSIKKPMSDHAVNLLLKNLNTLTNDEDTKIKIIERSIVNGWAGVFPLNSNQSYGKNNDSDTDNIFMKIGREGT